MRTGQRRYYERKIHLIITGLIINNSNNILYISFNTNNKREFVRKAECTKVAYCTETVCIGLGPLTLDLVSMCHATLKVLIPV